MIPTGHEPLGLGIDLGTSGLRLAVLDRSGTVLAERSSDYPSSFDDPLGWRQGVIALCAALPDELRDRVVAVAVMAPGTVLTCSANGEPRGSALPYFLACPEQAQAAAELAGSAASPAGSASGSLARVLRLLASTSGEQFLVRHQADWLSGWMLGDWRFGEEGNNLRLGWDLGQRSWQGAIADQPWVVPCRRSWPRVLDSFRCPRNQPCSGFAGTLPGGCRQHRCQRGEFAASSAWRWGDGAGHHLGAQAIFDDPAGGAGH